jgi:hypothetical protein
MRGGSKWSLGGSVRVPWALIMDAWRLKMEPWRVCRPEIADSNLCDEEQEPDPQQSEKRDLDPQ